MNSLLHYSNLRLLWLCWLTVAFSLPASTYGQTVAGLPLGSTPCDYHLRWDGQSTRLQVKLDYTAVSSDSTVFLFDPSSMGGQSDLFPILEGITAGPTDRLRLVAAQHKIVVYHRRQAGRHSLRYTLNGAITGPRQSASPRELFRPVIQPGSLYLASEFFVLQPQHCPPAAISLQFDQFPAKANYFLSAAPRAAPGARQVIQPGPDDTWVLVLGADIVRRTYQVHGIPYYTITSRRDTLTHVAQALEPFFTRYFPTLRTFWHDDDAAYYYLCVLPTFNTEPTAGGFNWGPGFIMKYAGPFDNWKKAVIAHETSHTWIGNKLQLGTDSFANQWFGEGFNDYVCLINLAASGIFSSSDFLDYFNERTLRAHYTSPLRGMPNDSIARNYWHNRDYQKLPYRRGLLYAFYLDNQVRLASQGQHTLRDVLLALAARNKELKAQDSAATLAVEDFLTAAGRFVPREQVAQEVARYMLQGHPLDFHQLPLIPAFRMTFDGEVPVLDVADTRALQAIYHW